MPPSSSNSQKKSSNIIRHSLNARGQAIINFILDDCYNMGAKHIPLYQRQLMLQKVKDAGNEWITMLKLDSYIVKRHKEFQATRSQTGTVALLTAAGPKTTMEEEEKLFGQISGETRMHLRWLYQVLRQEDYGDLQHWALQPEYSVTMQEFQAYFNYLASSGMPVFQGLSKDVRLKLQGLLRGYPNADHRMYRQWAKRIEVEDITEISAYIKHLQDVMGLKTGENQRSEDSDLPRASSRPPISIPVSSPKPPPEPGSTAELPSVPGAELSHTSDDPAHKTDCAESPAAQPESRRLSSPTSTLVGTKREQHTAPGDTFHVSDSTKRKGSIPPEEPFRLFGNHPLRVDRMPDSLQRDVRIVQAHTRSADARTAVLVRAQSIEVPLAPARELAALKPGEVTRTETVPVLADGPAGHEQRRTSATRSVQQESTIDRAYSRANDLQRSPEAAMQADGQQEEGAAAAAEVLGETGKESAPQTAMITQGDIVLNSVDDEGDSELMYPEDDEPTDMEVDELDSDDEPIVSHGDIASARQTTAQSFTAAFTSGSESLDVQAAGDGVEQPLRTLEGLKRWIDKHEQPIVELLKFRDSMRALGLIDKWQAMDGDLYH